MGCVYFFKHNNRDYVKIGMSSKDTPCERFASFLTYAPMGGEILGYFRTTDPAYYECEIHRKLKNRRLHGEWFDVNYSDIEPFILKYDKISAVKRLMFDIPIDVDEEDKTVLNLKCIKTYFYKLHLQTSNLSYNFLSAILKNHSGMKESEINEVDVTGLYKKYFERNEL